MVVANSVLVLGPFGKGVLCNRAGKAFGLKTSVLPNLLHSDPSGERSTRDLKASQRHVKSRGF